MLDTIEAKRYKLQTQLDLTKTQLERNKLGQFATPLSLAIEILEYTQLLLPSDLDIRFLDPAIGTGSFFSALLRIFPVTQISKAVGYEVDALYGQAANELWHSTPLELHIDDFTHTEPPSADNDKYTMLICNPPYVRHHHLLRTEKQRLQQLGEQRTGIKLSQQTGLYGHFLTLTHTWMARNGLACWLIPSEFMDVNYGQQIKKYLLTKVTLLQVHRFESQDVQFDDALVSSSIIWFLNKTPDKAHKVLFTYGGTVTNPKQSAKLSLDTLKLTTKWTMFPATTTTLKTRHKHGENVPIELLLSDVFTVKRGLATGANDFFLLSREQIAKYQIPNEFLKPVLPGPRYLKANEVAADAWGMPLLEKPVFLLNCTLVEEEIRYAYPSLWAYLQLGVVKGISSGYLCSHRKPWYSQENRPASLFLCSYMGRQDSKGKKPFRFILNHSNATATNAYHIMYPKAGLQQALKDDTQLATLIWTTLNLMTRETLTSEGRTYGGGLYKMEPRELGNVPAYDLLPFLHKYLPHMQQTFM